MAHVSRETQSQWKDYIVKILTEKFNTKYVHVCVHTRVLTYTMIYLVGKIT